MARLDADATRRYNKEYQQKNADKLREQAKKRWAEWYKKNKAKHIAEGCRRWKERDKIVDKKYDANALTNALQGRRARPGVPQATLPREQRKVPGEGVALARRKP